MTTNSPEAQPQGVELLPCPWCRPVESAPSPRAVEVNRHVTDGSIVMHWIECDECNCRGPYEQTAGLAASAWNTRADLPRPLSSSEALPLKDGGAEDVISRNAAMRAVCARCANPERYGPAQSIEGSERLWHLQLTDGWNAGQCDASAIVRLPCVTAESSERCGKFKPSSLGVPEPQDRCVLSGGHEGKHSLDSARVFPASTEQVGKL